jgi:4'-phosphopantetheinyl transferase
MKRFYQLNSIRADEVHLWYFSFSRPVTEVEGLVKLLSREECRRISQFRRSELRTQYILCHGVLRMIIGGYSGIDPGDVAFEYGPLGKPRISGLLEDGGIEFNMAHSRDLCVYALNLRSRIGIDIEYLSSFPEMEAVASRIFGSKTHEIWQSLPEEEKIRAFYNGWTRKEAFLKGLGTGLESGLRDVEVTIAPEEPARFLGFKEARGGAPPWSLESISFHSQYIGAVAYEGSRKKVRMWEWAG